MSSAPQDPPVDDTTKMADEQMDDTTTPAAAATDATKGGASAKDEGAINEQSGSTANSINNSELGSSGIRPIFLGNLSHSAVSADIEQMFRNPVSRYGGVAEEEKEEGMASEIAPFDLDRVVSFCIILY